jgi:hypothetical protein
MTPDPGRPTVLDPATQAEVLCLLESGAFRSSACRAAGISYRAFRYWEKLWEDGDGRAARFGKFFESVGRAETRIEVARLAEVRSGGPGWRAAAWLLGRRFPERWGRRASSPVPSENVTKLGDDELLEIARGCGPVAGVGRSSR